MLKFEDLREHGIDLSEDLVVETVLYPMSVFPGHEGRELAQGFLDEEHALRVMYEQTPEEIVIVTFYPGRSARYEQDAL